MTWALFLDDYRFPEDIKIRRSDWMIARNYDEAVSLVTEYGVPLYISFDHDLADHHYAMFHEGITPGNGEKTGLTFAKWFCDHVLDNNLTLPDEFGYYVHSMNPAGARNIDNYMRNFLRRVYKHEEYMRTPK